MSPKVVCLVVLRSFFGKWNVFIGQGNVMLGHPILSSLYCHGAENGDFFHADERPTKVALV